MKGKLPVFALLVAGLLIFGCAYSSSPQSEMSGGKELRDFNGTKILVEIADTPEKVKQGLMGREDLCDECGMLFVYAQDVEDVYWMKNMKMRIDIVFLDENYTPVKIFENVPICEKDPCPAYSAGKPYRYVLEVKAGKAKGIFG